MGKVKFLKHRDIENAALCLLAEYGRKYGEVTQPPIPVEEVLEAHLKLSLDFDNLPERLGAADVLGAMWVRDRQVIIDESLVPEDNPKKQGRYRFTLSHEIGHWELHRHYFLADDAQPKLFGKKPKPSIVCRSRSRKEPIEWQADMFAGYLLMPQAMIMRAWESHYGTPDPYIAKDEIADLSARWGLAEDEQPTVEIAKDLARAFNVSGQAMQIRLIGMGLIRTEAPAPGLFAS